MYQDLELLTAAAAAGDRAAWDELVDIYAAAVWELARAGVGPERAGAASELAWLRAVQAVHASPRIGVAVWDVLKAAVLCELSDEKGWSPPGGPSTGACRAGTERPRRTRAGQRITVALPAHRIAAGTVVAVTSRDGLRRRFALPEGAAPGAVVLLPGDDGGVEIVIDLRTGGRPAASGPVSPASAGCSRPGRPRAPRR
jgi:hypothetical protein